MLREKIKLVELILAEYHFAPLKPEALDHLEIGNSFLS